MIGDSGVGKTALVRKYIYNQVGKFAVTIGADLQFVDMDIINNNGKIIASNKMVIWDTAGQERYSSCPEQYFARAEGIVVVYDITKQKTFLSCAEWLVKVLAHAKNKNLQFILVGNKLDLEDERVVSTQDGKDFAMNNGMDFIEISAEQGLNIDEVFSRMAKKLFMRKLTTNKKHEIVKPEYISLSEKASSNTIDINSEKKESNCACILI